MKRILLAEDDNTTRFSLAYLLRHAGYDVNEAPDGETAITLLTNSQFDLVITDIIMGMVDGMEVLHFARRQPYRPEVILLTGHGSMETAVLALREGAFDYLLKPCTSNQLLITVSRALQQQQRDQQLRTAAQMLMVDLYDTLPGSQPAQPGLNPPAPASSADAQQTIPMHIGALVCGGHRGEVMFNGQPIHLTNTEYMLLCYLMRHAGQLCPAADIVYHVHGLDVAETEAQILIKSHIHKLRKKIHPDYFVTVRGKGYRLVVPNE